MKHLKVGDKAPLFSAKDGEGNTVSLSNFVGKTVVLFFYPRDNTPTCTVEACNLRDNYGQLQKAGLVVFGISPDNEQSHVKFAQKHQLPFPLLVDSDLTISNAYGVWGPKKFMGRDIIGIHRTTFILDEKLEIKAIVEKVKSKEHSAQIFELLS